MSISGNVQKNITVVGLSFTLFFHQLSVVWLHNFKLNWMFQRSHGFSEMAVVHEVSLSAKACALIN